MLTITMTSAKLPGEIIFTYNEQCRLAALLITEPLSDEQYTWLLANLPWRTEMLQALSAKIPTATFVEKKMEVTFDMFWNRYADKDRSSKKKTQAQWDKMPVTEQAKAYAFIPKYNRLRGPADKKYATTYLSDELWNN